MLYISCNITITCGSPLPLSSGHIAYCRHVEHPVRSGCHSHVMLDNLSDGYGRFRCAYGIRETNIGSWPCNIRYLMRLLFRGSIRKYSCNAETHTHAYIRATHPPPPIYTYIVSVDDIHGSNSECWYVDSDGIAGFARQMVNGYQFVSTHMASNRYCTVRRLFSPINPTRPPSLLTNAKAA